MLIRKSLSPVALAIALSLSLQPVLAQETTAGLSGRVTDRSNQPLVGAEVTMVHAGTGRTLKTTTDSEGRYRFSGLRAGGPYTLSSSGQSLTGVSLALDDSNIVDMTGSNAAQLETVVVNANQLSFGTSALHLDEDEIRAQPTPDGTITNLVRLNPHFQVINRVSNQISVLGQNPRYNSLRLDGVDIGDTFGLEVSNQPTPRQPFLLESLEAISATAVDYDASSAGAAGGVINAVTKSGTNVFNGSVFGTYRDHRMVRDNADGSDYTGFNRERAIGFTLGGPLVKDRLFFFVDAEDYRLSAPMPSYGPIGSGATNIVNLTQADIDAARSIAQTRWGFDPGTIGGVNDAETSGRTWGAKFDWNITDAHRLVYRHASTSQSQANFPGIAPNSLAFSSYGYQRTFDLETDSLQLLSTWNEYLSTHASVSYRQYETNREPNSRLPAVGVIVNPTAILFMGTEENSYLNRLQNDAFSASFGAQLTAGAHVIDAGLDWSRNKINNIYARRINGTYAFFTLPRFQAGVATPFRFSYPSGGNPSNMAADWTLANMGAYVQDAWVVTDRFTLTLGLRYDKSSVDETPIHNPAAQAAFGFDNRVTLDGKGLLQPRLSFKYDAAEGLTLMGGVGLFRGQSPGVWLSNPFSNTGLNYIDYNFPAFPGFNPDPDNQIALVPPNAPGATQSIDLISPNLSQPSVWKANLAIQQALPWWGAIGRAELVVASVRDGIYYQNLNLGTATATGRDGRALYWNAAGLNPASWNVAGTPSTQVRARSLAHPGYSDVMLATATKRGSTAQFALGIDKPFGRSDWAWSAGYTFTRTRDVSPLGSFNSASLWGGRTSFHPNEDAAGTSIYEIRDRFTASLNWKHIFFGNSATTASLFYEGRSGRPFSYVFDNDANGDGVAGNDLLYIPSARGEVVFGSAAEEGAFFNMVDGTPYLRDNRGGLASRNGARAGWVNQFDLRVGQELPAFSPNHRAEIWLDILNVGNLLNKDWGKVEDPQYPANRGIVEFGGVCGATPAGACAAGDGGKYVYRVNTPDQLGVYDDNAVSRWSVQLGFRYAF